MGESRHRSANAKSSSSKLAEERRARSRSRAFQRVRSKSRAARFEVRDAAPDVREENINKFVEYKKFGLLATDCCRVIAIDEIPEVTQKWQVIVKVKVCRYLCIFFH